MTDRVGSASVRLPPPIGFVLGGGASLGAVQVGMLRALAEHGIHPDTITGTSVGALNGAIVAADADAAVDRLTRTWAELDRHDIFPGNLLGLVWRLGRSRTHAFESSGLEATIEAALDVRTFDDLQVPLGVVAVELATGGERVLRSGPLVPALLASAAIPGVYPSVTVDGRLLVDGAVTANVPITQALARGAGSLVVLDTTVPAVPTPGEGTVADVLARVSLLQMRAQLRASLPLAAAQVPVLCLPAPQPRTVSPLEFTHTAALIEDAYSGSAAFLDELRIDGPGLYGDPYTRYVTGDPNAPAASLGSSISA